MTDHFTKFAIAIATKDQTDRWEEQPSIDLRKPSPEMPVYVVQSEDQSRPEWTLHRNLLLPIGHVPVEEIRKQTADNTLEADPEPPAVAETEPEYTTSGDSDDESDIVIVEEVVSHQPSGHTPVNASSSSSSTRTCQSNCTTRGGTTTTTACTTTTPTSRWTNRPTSACPSSQKIQPSRQAACMGNIR